MIFHAILLQEVIEIKKDVRQIQVQLQATLSEAASGESQLQQSRQELKTEHERLAKLRNKVCPYLFKNARSIVTSRPVAARGFDV